MSSNCPSSEVDELAVCLLTVFEQRGITFELLEALIKQEVEDTGMRLHQQSIVRTCTYLTHCVENETELLRRTCVATKMLSIYAKWKGSQYLKDTLQKVLERLMLTSDDLDLELDPARVTGAEELQKNALQLRIVAKVFIDDICASAANIPASFKKICHLVS
jgi:neurofibromin 1